MPLKEGSEKPLGNPGQWSPTPAVYSLMGRVQPIGSMASAQTLG